MNAIAKYVFIILSFFSICSCCMTRSKTTEFLPGKIAVNRNDSMYIYDNSNIISARFKIKGEEFEYSGFKWSNKEGGLIGIQYFNSVRKGTTRSSIVHFNILGQIGETIYESKEGEIAGHAYLSKNDNNLLFTIDKIGNSNVDELEGLNREKNVLLFDYKHKILSRKIENIGTSLNFDLRESPWLIDEHRFIFTISADKQLTIDSSTINLIKKDSLGIYIYDLKTNLKKLLVQNASFGICSPTNLSIAYIKDQSIKVLNLEENSTRIIYAVTPKDRIINIHWTPDGKCIYIAYYKNSVDGYEREEKLIQVKDIKEKLFMKTGHGFQSYTWQ